MPRAFRWIARFLAGVAVATAPACVDTGAVTPEEKARAILERHAGDEDAARAAWRAEPGNWRLGLDHEVATSDPVAPVVVRTERELVTAAVGRCGGGPGPVTFRTDVLEPGGGLLARFRWPTLDRGSRGHARVRAALAEGRGDAALLWAKVAGDPALDEACVSFRDRRERCPGGSS